MTVTYPDLSELRPRYATRVENLSPLFLLARGLTVNHLGRIVDTITPLALTHSCLFFPFRTAKETVGPV